jgi:hypothetical protein
MPNDFFNSAGVLQQAECYDALVIMQGASGLPEDRFLNTWHFAAEAGGTADSHYSAIQFELGSFYTAIKPYLSSVALGATNLQIETRIYHGDDPEPREPHTVLLGVDMTPHPNIGLPNELAICVSHYHRRNIPRQRGRVFIGPLGNTAMAAGVSGAGDRRIDPTCQDAFVTAAIGLLTGTNGVVWCQKSNYQFSATGDPAVGPTYREVTNGWVDNAFDIQRRRGTVASVRDTFAA